jgi:uncharacterized repeat protein (TIGR01451 family)
MISYNVQLDVSLLTTNNFNGDGGTMRLALTILALSILWAGAALAQPFAYITNQDGNNVTVIDTSTNMLVGSPIPVESFPNSAAITPDGNFVYVANGGSASVSVIDTSTNTVTATVTVGSGPGGLAITPDGKFVYVVNNGDNNVSIIDASTNTVVGSPIAVQTAPFIATVTPDGKFVYVTNFTSGTVSVIDTSTNTITATVTVGPGPLGVAVSPDGSRAYTANNGFGPGTVSVIRTSNNMVIATVTVGVQARGIAVTPDGNFVYATNAASGTVSVIRTSDNMAIKTVSVQTLPQGVDVTPDGNFVYVANQGPGTVSVIRTSDNTVIDTISVGNVSWGPAAYGKFIGPPPVTLDIALAGSGVGNVSATGIDCGDGGVDCMETYHIVGTMVELTAAPDATSFFSGWSGGTGCTGSDPNLSITMDSSKTCTATFTVDPAVTVNKAGNGDGTITSMPPGIDCAPGCTTDIVEFMELSMVELTAAPDPDSNFAGWSGDPDCTDGMVTMDGSKSCTATFNLKEFKLDVTKAGNGGGTVTSAPAGIDCGGDCSETYNIHAEITLTPTPDPDSNFAGWSGAPDCTNGHVTINKDKTCTATFILKRFKLDVTKAGNGGGTVTSAPPGIDCGGDCSEMYNINTVVTLTPVLGRNSKFAGWTGDPDCKGGTVTMDMDKKCTAVFESTVPTVKSADVSVVKTPSPDPVEAGSELTYSFKIKNSGPGAATGAELTDILPEGVMFVSASPSCVSEDSTISCSLGVLSKGETNTVSIVVIPLEIGSITNSATVNSAAYDPNPSNNTSTATVDVIGDITEFLNVEPNFETITTTPGGMVSIPVEISNPDIAQTNSLAQTKQTAAGVVVTIDIPEEFDVEELLTTQGVCSIDLRECVIGDILPGEIVTVVVDAVAPEGDGVYNVSFNVSTSTGQEFTGNATVRVSSGGEGSGSCALASNNTGKTELLGLLAPLMLPPLVMVLRRKKRKE